MMTTIKEQATAWRGTPLIWGVWALGATLLGLIFYAGLVNIVSDWSREEYSHAYLIPFVSLYFVWQKRDVLVRQPLTGSWFGVVFILLGVLGYVVGELSSLFIIVEYGFLSALLGLLLVMLGMAGFRAIWPAFVLLIFTIPLPQFFQTALTAKLQLISSELGVAVIRLFDISVFLEGNVIDLGSMKLQVVEACSGLNYLFPLMALGFIVAYLFKVAAWKRALLFLSTIPITVLMNSTRIGLIGVTVEYWGKQAAEGFLHDFEGWVVFMASTVLLVLEMWVLVRIGKHKTTLREAFNLEAPVMPPSDVAYTPRKLSVQAWPAIGLLIVAALVSIMLPDREEDVPKRESFTHFPMSIDTWQGQSSQMEQQFIDILKFRDYLLADYRDANQHTVNFYVAYYDSQRKGESAHSPRTCLPGGGWLVSEFGQKTLDEIQVNGQPLRVNRSVIQMGERKQLVYYWFQQRGRVITNEYLVKWYLFWDSLTRNRSDGALVRLTALVAPGQSVAQVDAMLTAFARSTVPKLDRYVPD